MPTLVRSNLSLWINFILSAIPPRSRATFIELLGGCLVSPEGGVTRTISAIKRGKHWTTYYKLIERGNVRVLPLARALFRLVLSVAYPEIVTLVIDDTLVLRTSERAPASTSRHDHTHKKNRPKFVISQCWVTLGVSLLGTGNRSTVLPILSRLVPVAGNRNQLKIARALIRAVLGGLLGTEPALVVRVLFDSWYMRGPLVLPLRRRRGRVIGQVRHDTALFLFPVVVEGPRRRGRPRIYGDRLKTDAVAALPVRELVLSLYGKEQRIRLRSIVGLARFLKATPVRAVWCEFFNEKNQAWNKPRLLLATETELTAEEVV